MHDSFAHCHKELLCNRQKQGSPCDACRYYFLDPLAYTIWGLIGSQLSDVTDVLILSQTGVTMPLDDYMTTTYKFRHPFIGATAGILIAFIILFHVLTAVALQKLNYLKR